MKINEFRRINLKIIKNDNVIYEGTAEELPEELQNLTTKEIKIQPNLAVITVNDEILEE